MLTLTRDQRSAAAARIAARISVWVQLAWDGASDPQARLMLMVLEEMARIEAEQGVPGSEDGIPIVALRGKQKTGE